MMRALVLLALTLLVSSHARADGPTLRRTAVIVGANSAAPGRKPLRFSENDARAVASVLIELGGFARGDVHVLIDPEPGEVLSTLDHALAESAGSESLLLFYYSGHADAAALYPHGRALPFSALRARLSDRRAAIRLGILDACRGGGWTGAKGLAEVAPFEVTLPMALESEGSALIASSSGLEDAHESELHGGSFFTHHWTAALRGAGDRNADGQVTLAEAFDYAKGLTIRDSALHTSVPQHPSFALNLRGRQDLALARLASASAIVAVDQREGPLELVHLGTGVVVLEVPRGPRTVRLAVAPGAYLLRRREGATVWSRELTVASGEVTRVDEAALELSGSEALAVKRAAPRPLTLTTLPRGMQEITFALGVSHDDIPGASLGTEGGFAHYALAPRGLTDRWQWVLPTLAFAYRAGTHGGTEWIPWFGVPSWGAGYSSMEGFILELKSLGAGLHVRRWLSSRSALTFGLGLTSFLRWHSDDSYTWTSPDGTVLHTRAKRILPTTWTARLSAGISHTLADTVTLHLSLELRDNLFTNGQLPTRSEVGDRLTLGIGSVQVVGARPQPLVQVHLSDWAALHADVSVHYTFHTKRTVETYMGGASFVW